MYSSFSQSLHDWEASPFKSKRHQLDIQRLLVEDRTQIYLVRAGDGQQMVAKRHSDWTTYYRELRGFELLGSQAPIPGLIAASDSGQFIVMEYVPDSWETKTTSDLCEVAKALGRLHACGSRNARFMKSFSQEATLGFLIRNTDSYLWAEDVEALRESLSLAAFKLGESYVPIQLGDFKEGHVRAREGECVLIDLETVDAGLESFDILSLLNIAPNKQLDASEWVTLVHAYIAGRDSVGELSLSVSDTLTTLHLTAVAIGLPSSLSESIPLTC